MFNRTANLSGRRPLLPEPSCRLQAVVPPRAPPRDQYRPAPAPRHPPDPYQPDYWKPSNVELEKRLQEARARDKVGYFQGKVTPPDLSLDRREAELVFRFDPHASAEYLSSQYKPPAVQYARPAVPANGIAPPRLPQQDGPFVFGVHSPSQFPLGRREDDDYDYSEVPEDRTVLRDDGSGDLNCCDRVNDWAVRDKVKKARSLNRMFCVKDKRKVKGGKKEKIKCVLVGDGAVGKSSLIAAYAQDKFRDEYTPTAYDTFNGKFIQKLEGLLGVY